MAHCALTEHAYPGAAGSRVGNSFDLLAGVAGPTPDLPDVDPVTQQARPQYLRVAGRPGSNTNFVSEVLAELFCHNYLQVMSTFVLKTSLIAKSLGCSGTEKED